MVNSKEFYKLGRDRHASGRLTLQHWMLRTQFDLFHSKITTAWAEDDPETPRKVADMACGNAIWTIEAAESGVTKNLQVVGFDISDDQFPECEGWPSNVTLHTGDMFKPPPKEYEGFFDVVNIRLVMITLRDGNPRPIIENALKMLKPGGYLQWVETDLPSPQAPAGSAYHRIGKIMTSAGGPRDFRWIKDLGIIFEDAGLREVEYFAEVPRKSMQKFFIDNYVMAITELARGMNSPDVDEWWTACEKERTEQGVLVLWENIRCVGRKSI